jgi:hypothetical protein
MATFEETSNRCVAAHAALVAAEQERRGLKRQLEEAEIESQPAVAEKVNETYADKRRKYK